MKNSFLQLCLLLIATVLVASGKDNRQNKELDSQRFGRSRIVVRQVLPRVKTINGGLPPQEIVEYEAKKFFAALKALPEGFIQRSGLKYVTFLNQPTFKGLPVGGLASGDVIILPVGFVDKTVYHELFHIFAPKRNVTKWQKLNQDKFVYTGSQYYEADLSRLKRKRKEQNLSSHAFDTDFVSAYAMSSEEEDRAETFAFMVSEKKDFLERTMKSPVLWKKMQFIIDITDKNKLLGKDFWIRNFSIKDLSELQQYQCSSAAIPEER